MMRRTYHAIIAQDQKSHNQILGAVAIACLMTPNKSAKKVSVISWFLKIRSLTTNIEIPKYQIIGSILLACHIIF